MTQPRRLRHVRVYRGRVVVLEAEQVGIESARRIWDVSVEALDWVRDQVAHHDIDCDLHWGHLHVATRPLHWRAHASDLPAARRRTARECVGVVTWTSA